jgi:diguanylate cyclase (GGDEF)-like protein/PAS domain S-box-containing protein
MPPGNSPAATRRCRPMMSWSLDVRTVILLLFFGNLVTVGILSAYTRDQGAARPYRLFLISKLIQAAAWALLGLRGEISDLLSAPIGNTLLFIGFSLEAVAFVSPYKQDQRLETLFATLAGVGSVAFWVFGNTPSQRVAIASLTTIALFGTAGVAILRNHGTSQVRRVIASSYALLCLVLVFRTGSALSGPAETGLMSGNPAQTAAFMTMFLFMLLGSTGFLLLMKERTDQLLSEAHRELQAREALLTNVFNTSSVAIFVVDSDGRITLANQRMAEMFDRPLDTLIGSLYVDYIDPLERAIAQQRMLALLDNSNAFLKLERQYVRLDGTSFWGLLTGARMYDPGAMAYRLVGVVADISDLKQAESRIREMAQRDPLTGLANRLLFSDRLQQAISVAQRDHSPLALLYLDLDNFKPVNDDFGHAVGDLLLREVAQRLTACVRHSDTVGRIGGDEYVLLLRTMNGDGSAQAIAEKVRQAIQQPFDIENHRISISCSIGVALYPDHGGDELTLQRSADVAMYRAKRDGRNMVRAAEAATPTLPAG